MPARRRPRRPRERDPAYLLAVALTALVAASRLFALPALLEWPSGAPAAGAALRQPAAHLLLTPFGAFADCMSCTGVLQHAALLLALLVGFAPFRYVVLGQRVARWRRLAETLSSFGLYLVLGAAAIAAIALAPRPASRLELRDPDELAVDFHSHTEASWDGRRGFSLERSAAWHAARGFAAAFITDHNLHSLGSPRRVGAFTALPGIELSVERAHMLVYGARPPVDPRRYSDGEPGFWRLLAEAGPRYGALAVPSLPEYWRHRRAQLPRLAAQVSGFEAYAGSPRGIEAADAARAPVAGLCARQRLFMTAGSDTHGYPTAACAWAVARVPGWRQLAPQALHERLLDGLRAGDLPLRIVARRRDAAPDDWRLWLEAPRGLWLMLRTWSWLQCLIACAWLWLGAATAARLRQMR